MLDIRKCLSSEGEGVWEGLGERFGEDLVEEDEGGSNGDSGNTKNYVL